MNVLVQFCTSMLKYKIHPCELHPELKKTQTFPGKKHRLEKTLKTSLETLSELVGKYEEAVGDQLFVNEKIVCPETDFKKYNRDRRWRNQNKNWNDFSMMWRTWYRDIFEQNCRQILSIFDKNKLDHAEYNKNLLEDILYVIVYIYHTKLQMLLRSKSKTI